MRPFTYLEPRDLDELIGVLAEKGSRSKLLAGGTDLLIQMQLGEWAPELVIALNRIPELQGIREEGSEIVIGAMATLREVERHPGVLQRLPSLAYSCGQVGSVQVRYLGTLIGNLTNAAPSADTIPALYAVRAVATVHGPNGQRSVPVSKITTGPGKTCLGTDEVITHLSLPSAKNQRGIYLKHCLRKAMDLAVVGVAASAEVEGGVCRDVQIALGAVAPTVIYATKAMEMLRGQRVTRDLIEGAATTAAGEACPISDIRASAEYRTDMVSALTRKALRYLFQNGA